MYRGEDSHHAYMFTSVSHTALGTKLVPRTKPPYSGPSVSTPGISAIWRVRLLIHMAWIRLLSMERKKVASLATLVISTTCLVLTMRYSRTAHVNGPRYLTSTAVILSEIIKFIVCVFMVFITGDKTWSSMTPAESIRGILRLAVPSTLYTIQNNLQFVAISNLDAATYQVTYQLKILATAMLSVMFLKKQLDNTKWASLILLTVGVALAQLPNTRSCHGEECLVANDNARKSWLTGLSAVIVMCVSSGFAGVYFEKLLKTSQPSLWTRNVQMAFSSIFFGCVCAAYTDGPAIASHGFLQGYNLLTWMIVIQQALLGLVVSLVIKHADNILKGFASAMSILLSSLVSYIFLAELPLNFLFLVGSATVLAASCMYGLSPTQMQISNVKSETV